MMSREVGIRLPNGNPAIPPVKIDPSKLESYKCKNCQGEIFSQQYILKRVSAIQTGSSSDSIIPLPIFVCLNCGQHLEIEN